VDRQFLKNSKQAIERMIFHVISLAIFPVLVCSSRKSPPVCPSACQSVSSITSRSFGGMMDCDDALLLPLLLWL